jgi:hypothetical protein
MDLRVCIKVINAAKFNTLSDTDWSPLKTLIMRKLYLMKQFLLLYNDTVAIRLD